MAKLGVHLTVADDFDPSPLLRRFASHSERAGRGTWFATFDSPLHGLALVQASAPTEVLGVTGLHPVDTDGWADWQQSAAGETEMTSRLLPTGTVSGIGDTVYRYEDIWAWDETLPSADPRTLRDLGLAGLSDEPLALAAGRGSWAWRAVKLAWKRAPVLGDPRVTAAIWLSKKGWEKLHDQSVAHRAVMERMEWERRTMIGLNDVRRHRLEQGSASSRRRARQYYTTLDALTAANS